MEKAGSFNGAAIASVKRDYYRFDFWYMSQDVTNNLLRNADLTEEHLKT